MPGGGAKSSTITKNVTVDNTGNASTLTNYPIKVNVTFKAGKNADFSDGKFKDGATSLSYWKESYVASTSALFWVNLASITGSASKTIQMTYKDGSSDLSNGDLTFDLYDNFNALYVEAIAANAASPVLAVDNYMAENIQFDSVTNKYWWIFEDASATQGIRLASADTITGTWTAEASLVINGPAHCPYLVKFGTYWYIYYVSGGGSSTGISVQKSTTVNSGYSASGISNPILSWGTSGTWDENRVWEPCVFQVGSTYYMFYMGEDVANLYEKTGYATSSAPDGGFTKYASNPVLSGTAAGTWDDGGDKAADPYVFLRNGTYYIGVTACTSGHGAWRIGMWKTTDFITFTEVVRSNPVLGHGAAGQWDTTLVLRGAVFFDGSTWYMAYCGSGTGATYRMGLTTITWDSMVNEIDLNKWTTNTSAPTISGGNLNTTANTLAQSLLTFGEGYSVRSKTKLGASGNNTLAMRNLATNPCLEIITNYFSSNNLNAYQHVSGDVNSGVLSSIAASNILEMSRKTGVSVAYSVNDAAPTELSTQVPTTALPVLINNVATTDWILVRKYSYTEPVITVAP